MTNRNGSSNVALGATALRMHVEPQTWKGRPVPPLLAGWFDQLMEQAPLILQGSAVHYIDVTLTAASAGNYAKPPQILFK